jgi:valyl-tRNA synthetase
VWSTFGTSPNPDNVEQQLNRWVSEGRLAYFNKQFSADIVEDSQDATGTSRGNLSSRFVCVAPRNEYIEQWLETNGYQQDPDVLDTWFSSALWPHSTLGWPEQTDALKKWYPTSVLLTGRDIITLWVARMVMTGMYNMGASQEMRDVRRETGTSHLSSLISHLSPDRERAKALGIPFHHVAINPTILDGKGERMSKSKGNGVDPVDIIETHGADALRFTLCSMATETQDVRMPVKKLPDGRNTSEKFDFGRNFCNKLWNAARFVLSTLSASPASARHDPGALSLADRWIISRFNATVAETNTAISHYRFDQYAKACYDFFWRDFCDWYVEASKPAMKDPNRAGQTAEVLAAVLDGALRLMHPVTPFITETIWWRLNEVRPTRGLPGLLDCPPSERLIKAAWPSEGTINEAAEHVFPRLQAVIGAIRNLRNDHKVDQKKRVTVSVSPPGDDAVKVTDENRELIEVLAVCTIREVRDKMPAPANSLRTSVDGCDIYIEDLVDAGAEQARISKRIEDLKKQRSTLVGRLGNESYIAKAPPQLVEQTRKQLSDVEAALRKLEG